jgi:thiopurine S-methyltransferase
MDTMFWHQKWKNEEIAFHQGEVNPLLLNYFHTLSLAKGSRVFVPLCGKTLDISWLLSNGYRVAGAELSNLAVEQLFAALNLKPQISRMGEIKHYSAPNIDIFVGDIFALSDKMLGSVDAIYDRAALVALPKPMRDLYTVYLSQITKKAPQLLICYEYDQTLMAGPPFSINTKEINQHYSEVYDLTLLASIDVPSGLRDIQVLKENVWLLKPA